MRKNILVTGGAGFIGSNFVPYFCEKYPDYHIINLDKLTYVGNLENLKECNSMDNYTFVQGDICDVAFLEKLFAQYDVRGVIHFAAESHVDNSITGPRPFIETNILGTFNLLETARKHWMLAPNQYKEGYEAILQGSISPLISSLFSGVGGVCISFHIILSCSISNIIID